MLLSNIKAKVANIMNLSLYIILNISLLNQILNVTFLPVLEKNREPSFQSCDEFHDARVHIYSYYFCCAFTGGSANIIHEP